LEHFRWLQPVPTSGRSRKKTVETSFILANNALAKTKLASVSQLDSDSDTFINDPWSEVDWQTSCWMRQVKLAAMPTLLCMSLCSAFSLIRLASR